MYADDLIIITHNLGDIERCYKVIAEWAEEFNMIVNKKKSGIMYIPIGRDTLT